MNSRNYIAQSVINKENQLREMQEKLAMAYFKPESQH
jgi:hypothetical protein